MKIETTKPKAVKSVKEAAAVCDNIPEPHLVDDRGLKYRESSSGEYLLFDLSEYVTEERDVSAFIELIDTPAQVVNYGGKMVGVAI